MSIWGTALRLAFGSLWAYKARSLLTMLGIIIGIGSVIVMISIGRGAKANIQEQISSQRTAEIEFPTKWPAEVPERWKELLTRLLAPEPEGRFADYDTFEAALQELSPIGFTNAGLLSRSMAFAVDLACAGLLMAPFILPGQFEGQISAQISL